MTPNPIFSNLNKSRVAEKLGVSRQAIYNWERKKIPAERVVELSQVTGIAREKLRPDLYT
tara:strand:- start:166 stop:345 length:180 start_codon:yes stop_codon:yes gene_type:complete